MIRRFTLAVCIFALAVLSRAVPAAAQSESPDAMFERGRGYLTEARTATVMAGGLARETVQLTARTTASGVQPMEATPAPTTNTASSGSILPTLGIVVGIVGVMLIGGGFGGLVYGNGQASQYNSDAMCPGTTSAMQVSSTCQGYATGAGLGSALEIGGFAGGGVLVAVAAALVFAGRGSLEQPATLRVACGPGLGVSSVSCAVRF